MGQLTRLCNLREQNPCIPLMSCMPPFSPCPFPIYQYLEIIEQERLENEALKQLMKEEEAAAVAAAAAAEADW